MAVYTMTSSLDSGVMTNEKWFSFADNMKGFVAHFSMPAYATAHFRVFFNVIHYAHAQGSLDNTAMTALTDQGGVYLQAAVATQDCPGSIFILGS